MSDKNGIQVLLLNIGNSYKDGMDTKDVYREVRRAWKKPAQDVEYVLAVSHSQVKGVFRILRWYRYSPEPGLWAFEAEEAPLNIRKKYEDQKFRMYGPMGYAN